MARRRIERPVAGVAQSGQNELVIVQFRIDGRDIKLRRRESGPDFPNPLPRGDDGQYFHSRNSPTRKAVTAANTEPPVASIGSKINAVSTGRPAGNLL